MKTLKELQFANRECYEVKTITVPQDLDEITCNLDELYTGKDLYFKCNPATGKTIHITGDVPHGTFFGAVNNGQGTVDINTTVTLQNGQYVILLKLFDDVLTLNTNIT